MAATKLTGHQKAAIMLLSIGEDAAAEVMKHLAEDEIKGIAGFMSRFQEITPADVERVCNEYFIRTEKGVVPPIPLETKSQYLKKVLGKAVGEARADELLGEMLLAPPGGALEKLQWHAPHTVANFISREHPQVVAVILATMEEQGLADKVLAILPADLQKDVVERIAGLKTIPSERIRDIEESLEQMMASEEGNLYKGDSGTHRVAEVLNTSPVAMENAIMSHIEEKDPDLAERIRDQMLRFDDFIKMDNPGIQKVLNLSTMQDLVLALRTADEYLREHILSNLSNRMAQQIVDEIENLGPTRVTEIEAAQSRLTGIARELIGKGEVNILGRPGVVVA